MRIGLLLCDDVAPELQVTHQNYPEMFSALLTRLEPSVELVTYRVMEGQYPSTIDDCDAYIISGSKFGVNDDIDWIHTFETFVWQLFAANKPAAGICFGHQMMAKALGGEVVKSEKGWGVGVIQVERKSSHPFDWLNDGTSPDTYSLVVSHQDQVIEVPENAVVLFGNDFCPVAMFHVADTFLAVQGHPEFSPAYSAALMERRKDSIPADVIQAGKVSLTNNIDSDAVTKWILAFLKKAQGHH
ncbi:GMP synthase [Veronia nyctiphanis]|uniref:GMP synthase n=1 Tax=Veronia nyctiphanis TaxID=1278244 RepID=A0A4Q0YY10_9GAMM|nr:GMP synthase [Veronia nyctiphanis]RXJ74099.1 GMP synthase [Veronia nyctiphanis]